VNIVCRLGSLANGATTTVRLAVTPLATAGMVTNVASVGATTTDPIGINNRSGVITNISAASQGLASLSLNASAYITGDSLTLSATVTPGPTAVAADVYLAIQFPDGRVFFRQADGSFSGVIAPALANWTLAPFSGPVFNYTFSGLEQAGQYEWFLILASPGTNSIIGQIYASPLTFMP